MSILNDKDIAIFDRFLREEDNEQALKKMIFEAFALANVEITPAKLDQVFGAIDDVVEEWRGEDESK
jgi:hypothetical protein